MSEIQRVTVIGSGTMGHGIAQVAAMAGWDVILNDISSELISKGLERIQANLDAGVERGKVEAGLRDSSMARLRGEADLAAAASDADLVVEAVPEKLELKRKIFSTLSQHARVDALLATNTSSLSVSKIAEGCQAPERVCGMHFFNPVHILTLCEVIRAEATSDQTLDRATAAARAMGKTPIVVTDSPGFASSRLGVALGLEAMRMVEEGVASAEDIDAAMTLGYKHPMGPLKLTDLVGLDVRLSIAEYLWQELGEARFEPPEILRQKVADGHLGKKSGRGFYEWSTR